MRRFALLIGITLLLVGLAVLLRLRSSSVPPSGASSQTASTTNQRTVITASASSTSRLGFATDSARPSDAQNSRDTAEPSIVGLQTITRVAESNPDEAQAMLQKFQAARGPELHYALARRLATNSNERIVSAFCQVLTNTYNGAQLTRSQADKLSAVAGMMGPLARKYDSGLEFLTVAIEPEYWRSWCKWKSAYTEQEQTRMLVSMCLISLGSSGRPEAQAILDEYRNGKRDAKSMSLAGSVVDAAFALARAKERDPLSTTSQRHQNGEELVTRFQRWITTPEGQAWWSWSQSEGGLTEKDVKRF